MSVWRTVLGIVLVLVVWWDAFETLLLPRRVSRRLRLSGLLLRVMWWGWSALGGWMSANGRRENYLSLYALLALLMLLAVWAIGLIVGFSLVLWGPGAHLAGDTLHGGFPQALYLSATSFVTLGIGDVTPVSGLARFIVTLEAGSGLVFLALVISYLPVLYQAFSRRETRLATLDEWAGSPPIAVELLRRAAASDAMDDVQVVLKDWESWAAELLESHLSYPILGYFRSQHDNQSWLAALTSVLDLCTIVLVGIEGVATAQAGRTFAMARHAAVDLSQVLDTTPHRVPGERHVGGLDELAARLSTEGLQLDTSSEAQSRFTKLLAGYEPYVEALSAHLQMPLPPLVPGADSRDNWQRSPWDAYEPP